MFFLCCSTDVTARSVSNLTKKTHTHTHTHTHTPNWHCFHVGVNMAAEELSVPRLLKHSCNFLVLTFFLSSFLSFLFFSFLPTRVSQHNQQVSLLCLIPGHTPCSTQWDIRIICLTSREAHGVPSAQVPLRPVMILLKYAACVTAATPVTHLCTPLRYPSPVTPPRPILHTHTHTHRSPTPLRGKGGGSVWVEVQDAACVL